MDKKLKTENMQKEHVYYKFMLYFDSNQSNQGRQV